MTAAGAAGSEETLRDGRVVTVCPLRAGDTAGVAAMWRRLDAPARRRFTDLAHLPSERAGEVALPRPGHAAGIIAIAPAGSVAGVARYERMAGDAAGFLVFVDASWRRAGLAALALLNGPSLGVSGFVSVGNTVDLTPNDLLLCWDEDPGTHVVLAYLESVPDPRRFARITRRISRHQPVVAVKAGRTGPGAGRRPRIPPRWRPGKPRSRRCSTRPG